MMSMTHILKMSAEIQNQTAVTSAISASCIICTLCAGFIQFLLSWDGKITNYHISDCMIIMNNNSDCGQLTLLDLHVDSLNTTFLKFSSSVGLLLRVRNVKGGARV